jgi:hypothetical protein
MLEAAELRRSWSCIRDVRVYVQWGSERGREQLPREAVALWAALEHREALKPVGGGVPSPLPPMPPGFNQSELSEWRNRLCFEIDVEVPDEVFAVWTVTPEPAWYQYARGKGERPPLVPTHAYPGLRW